MNIGPISDISHKGSVVEAVLSSRYARRAVVKAPATSVRRASQMNSMCRKIIAAALLLMVVGLTAADRAQGDQPANAGTTLFQNVRIFDGKGSALCAVQCACQRQRHRTHLDRADRRRTRCRGGCRGRAHLDARPDRCALACDAGYGPIPLRRSLGTHPRLRLRRGKRRWEPEGSDRRA